MHYLEFPTYCDKKLIPFNYSGEVSGNPDLGSDNYFNDLFYCVHSITLGGFGADRFYLGQWREGLGKLFSFGGLGIWTLIDVLLIGVGYVGPADGSLYI